MKNLKAISAFLTSKLSNELAIISTATALKQWLHGDTTPVVDTLQALTGQTYPKRTTTETSEQYRAALVQSLCTANGTDAVKSRLNALGLTLSNLTVDVDVIDLAGNVPALIKTCLQESKEQRAAKKAEKQSEAVTLEPTASKAKQPTKVTDTPTITAQAVIEAINANVFTASDIENIMQAINAQTIIV